MENDQPLEFNDNQGMCWLFGHKPDWDQGHLPCVRCGQTLNYEEVGWPGAIAWSRGYLSSIRKWFNRCYNCGLLFGRHTQECIDELPF